MHTKKHQNPVQAIFGVITKGIDNTDQVANHRMHESLIRYARQALLVLDSMKQN